MGTNKTLNGTYAKLQHKKKYMKRKNLALNSGRSSMKPCGTFTLLVSCVYLIEDEITPNYKLIIHANSVYSSSHCKGSPPNFVFNIKNILAN